jgi:hypothetical protein
VNLKQAKRHSTLLCPVVNFCGRKSVLVTADGIGVTSEYKGDICAESAKGKKVAIKILY